MFTGIGNRLEGELLGHISHHWVGIETGLKLPALGFTDRGVGLG